MLRGAFRQSVPQSSSKYQQIHTAETSEVLSTGVWELAIPANIRD